MRNPPNPSTWMAAAAVVVAIATATANAQWSVTFLHPPGASLSHAEGGSGGQQAGGGDFSLGRVHAFVWNGTAESWADLNPFGTGFAIAWDTNGGQQVGLADVNEVTQASLWRGSAASFEDLHQYLPPGFIGSGATDIWSDGTTIFISGFAYESQDDFAVLWSAPVPACPADFNHSGTLDSQDFFDFLAAFFAGC